MIENERENFYSMWRDTRSMYNRNVSVGELELVYSALERFALKDILRGIAMHVNDVQNGQFPITPAHVVAQIEGRGDERAGAAWRKLYGAIGEIGNYADVVFEDPIVHAIVDNEGGWVHVSLMTEEELKFMQARFNKQYTAYVSKSGQFEYPRVLRGSTNADRAAKGLELIAPETVGDRDKCRLVYRGGVETTLEIGRPKTMVEFLEPEPERDNEAGLKNVAQLISSTGLKRGKR